MPRIPLSNSAATVDAARPLDTLVFGGPVGEMSDVIIQIQDATIAWGADSNLQPIELSAGQIIGYSDRPVDLAKIYVRSNAPGVPGTIAIQGWKEA